MLTHEALQLTYTSDTPQWIDFRFAELISFNCFLLGFFKVTRGSNAHRSLSNDRVC